MEMCYDGALVMPSSYAVMNEEEMTYVEGGLSGVSSSKKWWGIQVALNSTRTNQFVVGLSAVYTAIGSAIGLVSAAAGILLGAVSWAYGALITYYNNNSSGIYLNFTWNAIAMCVLNPITGVTWAEIADRW